MQSSKISVVIPNYNHGCYLANALDASLAQSKKPFEIIIVDDASTDNSVALIESYQQKHDCIKLLKNEKNQGVIDSTNRGINAASGDFIVTRAADDADYADFYERASKMLEQYPEAGLCCGDIAFFGRDINIHQIESLQLTPEAAYLSPQNLAECLGIDPIYGHTVMMRAEHVKAVGGYEADLGCYADWFCTLLLAFKHGICYVPEPFAYARLTEESYSSNSHENVEENRSVFKKMLNILHSKYKDLMPLFLESGAFGFLGMDLATIQKTQQGILEYETKVFYEEPELQSKALESVIRKVLSEKKETINKIIANKGRFNVAIYGAGRHTRTLLPVWQDLGLPPINSIRVTGDVQEHQVLSRIPVCSIDRLTEKDVDLMIISSKSFEKTMANYCEEHLPAVLKLTFWDQTLTTL